MEKHAYLNDLPQSLEMHDHDTVVIGKKTEINSQTRYIGQTVEAGELKKAMVDLVLKTADLPSHLDQMQAEVNKASGFADDASASANTSVSAAELSEQQAELSGQHAQESEAHKNAAGQIERQCQTHVENAQDQANLSSRNAAAAKASEDKANEYTDICEGFAGGMVSVLTMQVNNYYHTAKSDGIA